MRASSSSSSSYPLPACPTPSVAASTPAVSGDASKSFADHMDQQNIEVSNPGGNFIQSTADTSSGGGATTAITGTDATPSSFPVAPSTSVPLTAVASCTRRTPRTPINEAVSGCATALEAVAGKGDESISVNGRAIPAHARNSRDTAAPEAPEAAPALSTPASATDLTALLVQAAALGASACTLHTAIQPIQQEAEKSSPSPTDTFGRGNPLPASSHENAAEKASLPEWASLPTLANSNRMTFQNAEIPSLTRAVLPSPTKEKKSTSAPVEGSFLQARSNSHSSDETVSVPSLPAVANPAPTSDRQEIASKSDDAQTVARSILGSVTEALGTSRDDTSPTMTAVLLHPAILAGFNSEHVPHADSNVNILLGSNHDFEDAIRQVVHIAQLSEATASRTPTRVAIELQTPPGAIVNVFVSRHEDTYRAQLSTNDPSALSWVQDKINILRDGNDLGVQVRWLPAQLESTTTLTTTSSTSDSNLNSNRDGQTPNQQPPEDRPQQRHPKRAGLLETIAGTSESALFGLEELGSAV